jgi:hypothetical protein
MLERFQQFRRLNGFGEELKIGENLNKLHLLFDTLYH